MEREDDVLHPDSDRLIERATHGTPGGGVERHLRECLACRREVARWRHAVDAFVRRDSEWGAAEQGCLDDQTIAALADGSMTGPARESAVEHLAICARCRSSVASVARALVSPTVRDAIDALDRPSRRPWLRVVIPIAALATLALILVPYPREVDPTIHRAPVTPPEPAPIAPSGPTSSVQVLRWHAVTGADRYRVTLFDEEGGVLWESALADTVAGLPSDVSLEPGRTYFWIVAARTGFDRWETSSLAEFSVAAGNRR